jgi:hypothetical protein
MAKWIKAEDCIKITMFIQIWTVSGRQFLWGVLDVENGELHTRSIFTDSYRGNIQQLQMLCAF